MIVKHLINRDFIISLQNIENMKKQKITQKVENYLGFEDLNFLKYFKNEFLGKDIN